MKFNKLFGNKWVTLYAGNDAERYQYIRQNLDQMKIKYKFNEYTAASRLAAQTFQSPSVPVSRGPTVTPYELQARLLKKKELDNYSIEIRTADAAEAHSAIGSELNRT